MDERCSMGLNRTCNDCKNNACPKHRDNIIPINRIQNACIAPLLLREHCVTTIVCSDCGKVCVMEEHLLAASTMLFQLGWREHNLKPSCPKCEERKDRDSFVKVE